MTRVTLLGLAVGVQLVATGCIGLGGGGGSGTGSLFDGGDSDDSSPLGSFASNSSGFGDNGAGGGFSDDLGVATTHNPEPASLALFGAGLAGVGLWRRRKASKRSS